MALFYPARLPMDGSGESMQNFGPSKKALARYGSTAAVSSVITLTDNTTVIEVAAMSGAGGSGLAIKWIASGDTQASVIATGANADFDNSIPPNYYRQFVVPIEKYGTTSIVGLNKQNGLYNRVAIVAHGTPTCSVLLAEF